MSRVSYPLRKYQTKLNEDESLEEISERLSKDFREVVASIHVYKLCSPRWWKVSKAIQKLSKVIIVEESLDQKEEEETLWEGNEVALRYVVEEGKVCILLRILEEYKSVQYALDEDYDKKTLPVEQLHVLRSIEENINTILRYALSHNEIVLTLEIPLLFDLICNAMKMSIASKNKFSEVAKYGLTMEASCFHLALAMMRKCDNIGEDRLMSIIKERKIFSLSLQHLLKNEKKFEDEDIQAGFKFISSVITTDDFGTCEEEYLQTAVIETLLQLEYLLQQHTEKNIGFKKTIRPLLDEIRRIKRNRRFK